MTSLFRDASRFLFSRIDSLPLLKSFGPDFWARWFLDIVFRSAPTTLSRYINSVKARVSQAPNLQPFRDILLLVRTSLTLSETGAAELHVCLLHHVGPTSPVPESFDSAVTKLGPVTSLRIVDATPDHLDRGPYQGGGQLYVSMARAASRAITAADVSASQLPGVVAFPALMNIWKTCSCCGLRRPHAERS
jgi:hypothetical protein